MNVFPVTFHLTDGTTVLAELVTSVTLPTQFWNLTPSANGIEYSGSPGGTPLQPPAWSVVPNVLNRTTSYSVNVLTTYLTPTSGCTCVINGTLPTGWAFNGTSLTYDGTSVNIVPTAGLTFTATLTSSGLTSVSNAFSLQGKGSPSTDTAAPTIPLGGVASGLTPTSVTLSAQPSSDPSPAGHTWSGLQQYNLKRTPPGSVIATVASAKGNQPIFLNQTIGAQSSIFSQTGADITIQTNGDLIYGTSDSFAFTAQQLTGNWTLSCKISAFTSTYAYSFAGLMARTSLAVDSPAVFALLTPFAQGAGFNVLARSSAGAAYAVGSYIANIAPAWLVMVRNGDTYTSYYSLDGNALVQIGSPVTQAMGATIYVGPALTSNQAGLQVTCDFTQVNLATLAGPSYTDATLTPGTFSYQWSAQDTVPNVSAYGTAISVTPGAVGGTAKWTPGHYMLSDTRPSYPNARGQFNSEIATMVATTGMKGWMGEYSWYWLEPSPGVYNWSLIDADLAALPAGYKLIIVVTLEDTGAHSIPFGGQPTPYSDGSYTNGMLPDDIIAGISGQGSDAINSGSGYPSYTAAWWRAPVYTRYAALLSAIGRQYDGNPNVEMIVVIQETSQNINPVPNDFNTTNCVAGWNAIIDATAAAWPTTVKIFDNNWSCAGAGTNELLASSQHAASKGFGFGGPDILDPAEGVTETTGAQILRGSIGGTDYRGHMASAYQEQADYFDWTSETPAGMESYAYNTLAATHIMWGIHGSSYAGSQYQWPAVTAALQAVNFRINKTGYHP